MRMTMLPMLFLLAVQCVAQQAVVNKQRHFKKTVPAGNYSGLCWLGGSRYAVVDDKSPTAGFHLMTIVTDSLSGAVRDVRWEGFMTSGQPNRDEEGVCYVPETGCLFVSSESDGHILEYTKDGHLTGRRLSVPEVFSDIYGNRGFEALTYNAQTHRFWTTSESTLRADGVKPDILQKIPNMLRLQSFGDDLQPREQYWYRSDSSAVRNVKGTSTLGVSALAALDDGRLVVLEREVRTTPRRFGSFVHVKLYVVNPARQSRGGVLEKRLLAEFRTKFNLTRRNFANYEGLCVGPTLQDGRTVLLLVADSQNQYKGLLRDWFRTVVVDLGS